MCHYWCYLCNRKVFGSYLKYHPSCKSFTRFLKSLSHTLFIFKTWFWRLDKFMINSKVLNRIGMYHFGLHSECSCINNTHCTRDRMHISSMNRCSCSLAKLNFIKMSRCKRLLLDHMDLYITRKPMILRKYLGKCKQFFVHWLSLCKFKLMKSNCMNKSAK